MQVKPVGDGVEHDREDQRQVALPFRQQQHQRQAAHQHDIERQHIHVERTEAQEQRLDHVCARSLEEILDDHLVHVELLARPCRDVSDLRHQHQEQQEMRGVDLPDPPRDARGADQDALLERRPAIDERGGEAGDEMKISAASEKP